MTKPLLVDSAIMGMDIWFMASISAIVALSAVLFKSLRKASGIAMLCVYLGYIALKYVS